MRKSRSPFKIETVKKKVEVSLADGETLLGSFFLSPTSPYHGGQERVIEMLNDERTYIPFEAENGSSIIIQKRSILKVLLIDGDNAHRRGSHNEAFVRIHFKEGDSMEGTLSYSMPNTHCRLSDFLNDCKGFFYFYSGDSLYLVNTRRVTFIEEVDSL